MKNRVQFSNTKQIAGFIIFLMLLLTSFSVYSQNVGINATGAAPNANAGLDVDFADKGVLIPRVALTGTTSFAPMSAHVAGMIVYNTATAGDVTPGFYYNNGTRWVPSMPAGTATGDMLYWNGSAWVRIPAGTPGQFLQFTSASIPTWTGAAFATLTTNAATAITATTATSGGIITADGGSAISTRGICYSTSPSPTTSNTIVANGAGLGSFSCNMTGLLPVTTYYVRAYATNNSVTTYGNEISFITSATLPTLAATTAASAITGSSATTGGNVTNSGGTAILERGVCYGTAANPTTANFKVIDGAPCTGSFTSYLTGLTGGTTYYVRAYATNILGTSYGTQISFTTTVIPPTLYTTAATSISGGSAVSGGSMNWNGPGYSNYQNYGVAYSTVSGSTNPTYVATNTTNYSVNPAVNIAPWTTTLPGLAANTTYYIRSYLNVYRGGWITVFGNELSFTTLPPTAPVVATTTAATLITDRSATSGGTITSDGGSAITAKGVCWGTSPNPVLGVGNFTTNGTGTNAFSSAITGLTGSTIYYVRAYATNAIGTSYGPVDITFTTLVQSPYALGQFVGYGWVVYVDPATGGGFIVSPDISSTYQWGCSGTSIATATALGTGQANTNLILTSCATRPIAASVADDYTGGGFTDWYLPSQGEMAKIGALASTIGFGSATNNYYTSSQVSATSAYSWFTNFSNGYASSVAKTPGGTSYVSYLRVVRNFAPNPPSAPTVLSTTAISGITATGAASGGDISSDGGATVTARGVCWNTTGSPTVADPKTTNGTGMGSFTSSITGLTTGTPYFVRAYATNSAGTSYGPELSFTPVAPGFPLVTTTAVSAVGATTAVSGGNVTSDGGSTVTERGVCWSTVPAPTTADTKTTDGTGTGVFVSNITGLTTGLTYYVRAYATNVTGTTYGVQFTFTPFTYATVTTDAVTNIAATTATSGGNVTGNGGSAVTARGVCWSTVTSPTIADPKTIDGSGTGTFVSSLTGLTTGTTYFVRAYATNGAGTAYGNEQTFTPVGVTIPTVTTTPVSSPTPTGGTSGGNVSSDGGDPVTARGVCWSTTPSPTIADFTTSNGTGTGSFVSTITGLTTGTGYYIRAYATNGIGTGYGAEEYFIPIGLPTVATLTLNYTAPDPTGTSGVSVTSDGGSALTALGIVWGTSPNPTVTSNLGITSENLGLGWYQSSLLTGLVQFTTYCVRAYATNAGGTSYGAEFSFTPGTLSAPIVSTDGIVNLIGAITECGATVYSDGGDPITSAGVCWGISADPTISTNLGITTDGFTGQYFSMITGLTVGTVYHVRAYATNGTGTSYGSDVTFTATAATVGQIIQGGNLSGTVFSVDGPGEHGLIAFPYEYLSTDWGCTSTSVGTSTALGAGLANTSAIIADITANTCTSGSTYNAFAPEVAQWFGPEWYLPSKDEFDLLWTNRIAAGIDFTTATFPIWSSSEADATHVWVFNGTTWVNTALKSSQNMVWTIRSF